MGTSKIQRQPLKVVFKTASSWDQKNPLQKKHTVTTQDTQNEFISFNFPLSPLFNPNFQPSTPSSVAINSLPPASLVGCYCRNVAKHATSPPSVDRDDDSCDPRRCWGFATGASAEDELDGLKSCRVHIYIYIYMQRWLDFGISEPSNCSFSLFNKE